MRTKTSIFKGVSKFRDKWRAREEAWAEEVKNL